TAKVELRKEMTTMLIILPVIRGMHNRLGCILLTALCSILISPALARAQSEQTSVSDQQMVKALVARIDQLEARVKQLEAAQQSAPLPPQAGPLHQESAGSNAALHHSQGPAAPATDSAQASIAQERETEPAEHAETERMDLSKTLLRI